MLNRISLQFMKPMHLASEAFVHAYYTPIRPREFGNAETRAFEIFLRTVKVGLSLVTYPLLLSAWSAGGVIDCLGDYLSKKKYTYLEGTAKEKGDKVSTFLTLNACMLWGGLPILFGGVRPARERIDKIASLILEKDPDILVMQEVSFEAGLSLWDKIKSHYSHGFSRIGPSPWLSLDTGLFIASKQALIKDPIFIPLPTNGTIKRGLFCFETASHIIFTTHLEAGNGKEDVAMRKKQVAEIILEMQKVSGKPALLLGDLNIKREGKDSDEYTSHLSPYFHNFYNPTIGKESSTCTNELTAYATGKIKTEDLWEHVDYALVLKSLSNPVSLQISLVPTYDIQGEALSDHKGLFVQI